MGKAEELGWRGSSDMHPSTFIKDEMAARRWTPDHLALAMAASVAGDPAVCRLKIDLYFEVGPTDERLRLGNTGLEIDAAFGLSPGFLHRLEATWLSARAEMRALAGERG